MWQISWNSVMVHGFGVAPQDVQWSPHSPMNFWRCCQQQLAPKNTKKEKYKIKMCTVCLKKTQCKKKVQVQTALRSLFDCVLVGKLNIYRKMIYKWIYTCTSSFKVLIISKFHLFIQKYSHLASKINIFFPGRWKCNTINQFILTFNRNTEPCILCANKKMDCEIDF